ncbi:MAG: 5'-methylthioadenosine/adenosylhomocysteine nucleosidase [Eubacteriales bacterium]
MNNPGRIGIIGAMRVEIEALAAALTEAETETVSGVEYRCGNLDGRPVVLAVCGVGKVFAALCAQTMILRWGAVSILNTGVAGTLTDELSVGDLAIATDVVQHDMDTSPLGDPPGLISGLNLVHMPADPALCRAVADAVAACGGKYACGTIASGDVFVADAKRKAHIRDTFGAIACEMEGAAVGQVCTVNRVPFAVIRAISDGGNEDSPMDYPTFVRMAAARSAAVVRAALPRLSSL